MYRVRTCACKDEPIGAALCVRLSTVARGSADRRSRFASIASTIDRVAMLMMSPNVISAMNVSKSGAAAMGA